MDGAGTEGSRVSGSEQGPDSDALGRQSGAELRQRARAIEIAGVHRRHEELLEIAVAEDGLTRSLAEQVHELALEEGLAPAYALALVAAEVGVLELVEPESPEDDSIQQNAPESVIAGNMDPAAIARERHLRASMRRFRAHLDRSGSADRAVDAFLAEPDVGHVAY